jgi:hypothetical protein
VIVRDGGVSFFLAGDSTYTQQSLLEKAVDGVSPSKVEALKTIQAILGYARKYPTVYLPCHDPESVVRLAKVSIVQVDHGG